MIEDTNLATRFWGQDIFDPRSFNYVEMVELASPKRMVWNAVFIAALAVIVYFVSGLTVGEILTMAENNPLFTAGVGLLVVIGILLKDDAGEAAGGEF